MSESGDDTIPASVNPDQNQDADEFCNKCALKMKPPIFDGTSRSSWPEYLIQFDLVAELNAWNERSKALYLASSLRGVARSILLDIDASERHDFSALVSCLNKRFGQGHQSEMFWEILNNQTRKPHETLQELAHEVKQLVRLAHPNAQPESVERLALRHFSNALNSADMRLRIAMAKPKTLDEAVTISIEIEAFNKAEQMRAESKMTRAVANTVETDVVSLMNALVNQLHSMEIEESKGDCYFCRRKGDETIPQRLLAVKLDAQRGALKENPKVNKKRGSPSRQKRDQENLVKWLARQNLMN